MPKAVFVAAAVNERSIAAQTMLVPSDHDDTGYLSPSVIPYFFSLSPQATSHGTIFRKTHTNEAQLPC
jgi:hypothetical protein